MIDQVGDTTLYIGNSNDARDYETLKKKEIYCVVNVAKDLEDPWFHGKFKHYKIGLNDGSHNKTYEYVIAARLVISLLNDGQGVLLHCHEGRSRSPAIAVIALACINWKDDMEEAVEKAEEMIKEDRPMIAIKDPHRIHIKSAVAAIRSAG